MKKLLVVAALMVATIGALAQNTAINGSVNFANTSSALGTAAPVSDSAGVLLSGAAYLAQVYAGTTESSLAPVGSPVAFKVNGLFSAGKLLIPTIGQGVKAFVKVGAWEAAGGATLEAALAAGKQTGFSGVVSVTTGGDDLVPPATPANLVGLTSWSLKPGTVIPEPTTIALGLLGAAGLLLRRRI